MHADGVVEYLIKFKHYDEPEWIAEHNTTGCKMLIREFEAVEAIKSLNIGSTTSKAKGKAITIAAVLGYGTPTTLATAELNLKNAMQGSDREAVLKAVEREEKKDVEKKVEKDDYIRIVTAEH